jgi:hypothetical protein
MTPSQKTVRLGDLAHARSGDKGDRANIGVVAEDGARYAWLETHLTEEVVAAYLRPLGIGPVRRYALPKIRALNFVIEHALAGAPAGRCASTRRARRWAWPCWNSGCRPPNRRPHEREPRPEGTTTGRSSS